METSSATSNSSLNKLSELEKIFFEQFTKRQDSNNDFLLRLLLIIGSVIFGYGYLLLKLEVENYDPSIIMFMLFFTEILLLIYFKVIYDEGFAFRRDQIVAFRILKKHGLLATNDKENGDPNKVFTSYYYPLKKFKVVNHKLKTKQKYVIFWMPAFHNTLAMAIFIIHLLIYSSFFVKIKNECLNKYLIGLLIATTLISISIVYRKHKWLKILYLKEFYTETA